MWVVKMFHKLNHSLHFYHCEGLCCPEPWKAPRNCPRNGFQPSIKFRHHIQHNLCRTFCYGKIEREDLTGQSNVSIGMKPA